MARSCSCCTSHAVSLRHSGAYRCDLSTGGMTPCMPCSFGLLPHPRSGACTLPNGSLGVTVSVRWIPVVTAAYGTRVAPPPERQCSHLTPTSQLDRRVRPVSGEQLLVGKSPIGLAAAGWETRTPGRPSPRSESGAYRRSDLRFLQTSGDHSCPLLSVGRPSAADPYGPSGSGRGGLWHCRGPRQDRIGRPTKSGRWAVGSWAEGTLCASGGLPILPNSTTSGGGKDGSQWR